MNLKILLTFLLCWIHIISVCQSSQLIDDLNNANDDSERMVIYRKLSNEMLLVDAQKSIYYAKEGWKIAMLKSEKIEEKHYFINQLGKAYAVSGDNNQAIDLFKDALNDIQINDSIKLEYYNSLGISYYEIEDFPLAISYGKEAIRLGDSLNLSHRVIASIGTIASIYRDQNDYKNALKFYTKGLQVSLKWDKPYFTAYAYKDIAFIQMKLQELDTALISVQKAINISNKNGYLFIESDARINLSEIYRNQSNLKEALIEASHAKTLAQKVKANRLILKSNFSIIDCYFELNQLDQANTLTNESLNLATKFDLKSEIIDANQYISKIASQKKDFKKAYEIELTIRELIKADQKKEKQHYFQLAENKAKRHNQDLEFQRINEAHQKGLINLKKSKAFGIIMSIVFLFTLLFSFILYRYGVIQKQVFNTSFFKNEQEVRLNYIKQTSTFSTILLIPILLYCYLWGNYSAAVATGISITIIIIAHFFARAKKNNLTFFALILLYGMSAISPLTSGAIYSVPLLNFGLFLGIHFLKPQPIFQLINTSFAILSTFLFYYFTKNYPSPEVQYPADLELIIGATAFFVANVTLFYFSKNINDYKEELIKKNNFLNQLADVNPHLIFAKDKNRKYTFANQILSNKYQIPKDGFIGKLYEDFENHDQNWAAQVKEDDLDILTNKTSVIGKEELIHDLNGTPMWVSNTKKPILNAQNEIEGILGVTIDITERKLREERLKESENRYRELFNLSFDGLFIVNHFGDILEINDSAKKLFGLKQKKHSKIISTYLPMITQIVDLKKFYDSQIHYTAPIRVNGKNELNDSIPLEMSMFKIPYFGESRIAFALKNISTQLILKEQEKALVLQKQELENLNKEFVSQEIFVNTKNKLLSEIKHDVTGIISLVDGNGKQELNKLIRKIGSTISDEENFFSFKLKFERSYPEFFDTLNNLSPKLTPNDLKLCAYMRLGMTSLDIANLQFIERKSVEMSKYRLKKKLQLEAEDDLNDFIQKV